MDLQKLNTMTKYPSILTYHTLGERGKLKEEVQVPFDQPAILTEKIDGVNARIILFPSGLYIIGSREELLYAKEDLIGNPQLGIVDTLKPVAEKFPTTRIEFAVLYLEVYGGRTTPGSKQYTGNRVMGHRLFDIAMIPNYHEILDKPIEEIAHWRDTGGQKFHDEFDFAYSSTMLGIRTVPRIGVADIPTSRQDTYDWMKTTISKTQAVLDKDAIGNPEGIVARSVDRKRIAKLRFEDYERTFRNK
jgi:hypothetical protein